MAPPIAISGAHHHVRAPVIRVGVICALVLLLQGRADALEESTGIGSHESSSSSSSSSSEGTSSRKSSIVNGVPPATTPPLLMRPAKGKAWLAALWNSTETPQKGASNDSTARTSGGPAGEAADGHLETGSKSNGDKTPVGKAENDSTTGGEASVGRTTTDKSGTFADWPAADSPKTERVASTAATNVTKQKCQIRVEETSLGLTGCPFDKLFNMMREWAGLFTAVTVSLDNHRSAGHSQVAPIRPITPPSSWWSSSLSEINKYTPPSTPWRILQLLNEKYYDMLELRLDLLHQIPIIAQNLTETVRRRTVLFILYDDLIEWVMLTLATENLDDVRKDIYLKEAPVELIDALKKQPTMIPHTMEMKNKMANVTRDVSRLSRLSE